MIREIPTSIGELGAEKGENTGPHERGGAVRWDDEAVLRVQRCGMQEVLGRIGEVEALMLPEVLHNLNVVPLGRLGRTPPSPASDLPESSHYLES